MIDTRITIKMIEAAINKGIRDIEDNPKRGIRNLVDLANHFASSPFQKDILKLMQTMLANLDSPYYDIVLDLINNVDHDIIKSFGINLGYNSWTKGAKKIRQHKKTYGYNVPWTIIFDLRKHTDNKINLDSIKDIIKQGKRIGIHTYMLFINNLDGLSNILKENPDCAFILYMSPNILREENISKIKSSKNTVVLILYEPQINSDNLKNTIQLLSNNKCLFGLYSYYGNENINDILSDKWVHEIINIKSPFGILMESKNCSKENAGLIQDYVFNSKTNQKHSSFLIDLYEDIARIDKNISVDPCIFTIMENGDISSSKFHRNENLNIENMSLTEILSKSY